MASASLCSRARQQPVGKPCLKRWSAQVGRSRLHGQSIQRWVTGSQHGVRLGSDPQSISSAAHERDQMARSKQTISASGATSSKIFLAEFTSGYPALLVKASSVLMPFLPALARL